MLTGTPLQNSVSELWTLLTFVLPNIFDNQQQFVDWFNSPFEISFHEKLSTDRNFSEPLASRTLACAENRQSTNGSSLLNINDSSDIVLALRRLLSPFLLRRELKDVKQQLPSKVRRRSNGICCYCNE